MNSDETQTVANEDESGDSSADETGSIEEEKDVEGETDSEPTIDEATSDAEREA